MVRLLGNINAGSTWGGVRRAHARQASHAYTDCQNRTRNYVFDLHLSFSLMVLSLLPSNAKYTHCSAICELLDHELDRTVEIIPQADALGVMKTAEPWSSLVDEADAWIR
jgi:hypothetical protein